MTINAEVYQLLAEMTPAEKAGQLPPYFYFRLSEGAQPVLDIDAEVQPRACPAPPQAGHHHLKWNPPGWAGVDVVVAFTVVDRAWSTKPYLLRYPSSTAGKPATAATKLTHAAYPMANDRR